MGSGGSIGDPSLRTRRRPPCRNFGADPRSAELATRMLTSGRALATLQHDFLTDVAEFDAAEAWRGDGAVSMAAWLTERLGVSGATARMWAQTAARLTELPELAATLGSGDASLDLVAPLAAMATPETDAKLAARATAGGLSVKQARELAAAHRGVTDEAEARRFEHRSFRFNDTNLTLWAAMTKDDYATTKALLMAGVSLDGSEASGTGPGADSGPGDVTLTGAQPNGYVPFNQRLYDSFMDVISGGRSTTKGNWYRPTMVVHADLGYLVGSDWDEGFSASDVPNGEGGACAVIQGIGPISAQVARRLACDAGIVFSVEGHDGCILDQKRARRSPTEAQRREIARRDKGCRFPGCSFTDFTQVHHVKLWTNGGETNQDNLLTLCGRHHRAVHELGWRVTGHCDELVTFTGPHGHSMTSGPSPTWPPAARKAASPTANGSAPLRR
jgi:Domain of unknown function (DUF222)